MEWKKVKGMIESGFNRRDTLQQLETYRIFGNLSQKDYDKGKKLIYKNFDK